MSRFNFHAFSSFQLSQSFNHPLLPSSSHQVVIQCLPSSEPHLQLASAELFHLFFSISSSYLLFAGSLHHHDRRCDGCQKKTGRAKDIRVSVWIDDGKFPARLVICKGEELCTHHPEQVVPQPLTSRSFVHHSIRNQWLICSSFNMEDRPIPWSFADIKQTLQPNLHIYKFIAIT